MGSPLPVIHGSKGCLALGSISKLARGFFDSYPFSSNSKPILASVSGMTFISEGTVNFFSFPLSLLKMSSHSPHLFFSWTQKTYFFSSLTCLALPPFIIHSAKSHRSSLAGRPHPHEADTTPAVLNQGPSGKRPWMLLNTLQFSGQRSAPMPTEGPCPKCQ